MRYEFAVITTDGETTDVPLPIAMAKMQDVAAGRNTFTAHEDKLIAEWALKINEIMMMR